ncbi:MAG: M23 family metallopeptidase [Anaerolineae bacterium]|nr:M23 family metallopeptidase [Anaerolineae bacterium]MDQ7037516.1 M23 family metallopeptidase [Anaerolineae bacterium]
MAQQPFIAKVIGIPHIPSIVQINVRTGPGTNADIAFKSPVGTANLPIIEVQEDAEKRNLEGKTYQWFRLLFPQGEGWARDDLIEISGDGTTVGYPILSNPITAFSIARQPVTTIQPGQETTPSSSETTQTFGWASPPIVETPADVQQEVVETQTATSAPTAVGEAVAIAMVEGVKLRPGPGTGHNPVAARMPFKSTAKILDSASGDDGKDFLWVKLEYQGTQGWAREDLVRYTGAFGTLGRSADDQYPNPVQNSNWVRDFDYPTASRLPWVHWGWDHGGLGQRKGAAILAGPQGGKVIATAVCQRCGSEGASAPEKGFSLSDQRVLGDAGWNFGYGHYVIVRYHNDILPESTKAELAKRGFEGGHCFVMYAHLQDILVQAGQDLQPNQQVATLGNSGNSEGPHLHLELRADKNANNRSWASMKKGLMTPQVLYLR